MLRTHSIYFYVSVCSQGLAIAQCKGELMSKLKPSCFFNVVLCISVTWDLLCFPGPILFSEINPRTGMAELRVGDLSDDRVHDLQACQRMEKDGPCLSLEWVCIKRKNSIVNSILY